MNESQLHQLHNLAKIAAILLLILAIQPSGGSQTSTLAAGFSQALIIVREAEAAGATPSELSGLTAPLNDAVTLYRQAVNLSPQKSAEQAQLMAQVTAILTAVQTNATHLASAASQRTYIDTVLTYAGAALAAAIGTAVYAFAFSLYRKSRIKRTLQMRISGK